MRGGLWCPLRGVRGVVDFVIRAPGRIRWGAGSAVWGVVSALRCVEHGSSARQRPAGRACGVWDHSSGRAPGGGVAPGARCVGCATLCGVRHKPSQRGTRCRRQEAGAGPWSQPQGSGPRAGPVPRILGESPRDECREVSLRGVSLGCGMRPRTGPPGCGLWRPDQPPGRAPGASPWYEPPGRALGGEPSARRAGRILGMSPRGEFRGCVCGMNPWVLGVNSRGGGWVAGENPRDESSG